MPENHVTEGQFVEYIHEAATQMNKIDDKINQVEKITAFNNKGNVQTYAALATIENPQVNDAYGVIADGLTYIYNGNSFPTEGNGMDLRIKPDGVVAENETLAVSGSKVFDYSLAISDYLRNKANEIKDYTFFNVTENFVWYQTATFPTKKGDSFDWSGFAAEPIGEFFNLQGIKVEDLPASDDLMVRKTINYVSPEDGYVFFRSANYLGNPFETTELKFNDVSVYAKPDVYEKLQTGEIGQMGVGIDSALPFADLPQSAYFLQKENLPYDVIIDTVLMYTLGEGHTTFAIGSIDQWGKFIERKSIPKPVVGAFANIKIFALNEILKAGEYLAIKTPNLNGMSWKPNSNNTGKMWDSVDSYTKELFHSPQYDMGWTVNFTRVTENPLAFNADVVNLDKRLQTIENKPLLSTDIVTGIPYKIVISNGVLGLKSMLFNKIVHLGNSICRHEITPFWWGDWGMAATIRENDYVHKFLEKYQVHNQLATTEALNIAGWEQNPTGFDKTTLNNILNNADLITISVGENASYNSDYKNQYKNLIQYIQTQCPTATIIICGMFWVNYSLETAMVEVAAELGLTFISFAGTDTAEYKQTLSTQVYGDDGQWHTISDGGAIAPGVANHPNDEWFELKANRLMSAIGY